MIDEILKYLNHYYPVSLDSISAVTTDGLLGDFEEEYFEGQYVYIHGTVMNDGVYQVVSATDEKITLDGTFTSEISNNRIKTVFGLSIPKDLLSLVSEIESFEDKRGLSSESIDDYSASFGSVNGAVWENAFKDRLSKYRRPYSDLDSFYRDYMWQNRW